MRIAAISGWVLALTLLPLAWAQAAATPPQATQATAQQQLLQDQQRLMQDEQKVRRDQQQLYRQAFGADQQQIDRQMHEARRAMQAAAQRMAQLSLQMSGPMMTRLTHMFDPDRAVLGVTVTNAEPGQNAAGVKLEAVTPGGPAAQGGLQAGDVITSINGAAFKTNVPESASDQLMDFMARVKPGDRLSLSYVRNGSGHTARVTAGRLSDYGFAWNMPAMPPVQPANMRAVFGPWPFFGHGGAWAGMQLVPLSAGLGQYFGTDKGLLVVRAPSDSALELKDGDVILQIGDRQPATPSDAMRVLYSYAPGDALTLHILRKTKPMSLDITVPKQNRSVPGPYQPMNFHDW